jgi:hypothetical protein
MFAASVSCFLPTVPRDTFAVKDRLAALSFLTDRRKLGGGRGAEHRDNAHTSATTLRPPAAPARRS